MDAVSKKDSGVLPRHRNGYALLPKIRVEIVLAKVPVNDVVNAARRVLYTGHIGDGKIFISHMDNAVKIRTGEQGYDAMQGNDE